MGRVGDDDIGHKPYRPRPFRPKKYHPQTILATVNDYIGHISATRNLHMMPRHVYMTSACTSLVYIENVVRDKAATSAEGQDHSHATPAVEGVGQVQGWQSVC